MSDDPQVSRCCGAEIRKKFAYTRKGVWLCTACGKPCEPREREEELRRLEDILWSDYRFAFYAKRFVRPTAEFILEYRRSSPAPTSEQVERSAREAAEEIGLALVSAAIKKNMDKITHDDLAKIILRHFTPLFGKEGKGKE